jgi:hypothetical protein
MSFTIYDTMEKDQSKNVVIRKSKTDAFSKYKKIQGERFLIDEKKLSAKADFLIIELDEGRDLHFTMIYSKKIKSRVDLVEVFKEMLKTLNKYPELIQEYSDLSYFGQGAIDYWADATTTVKYPFNITPPRDYIRKVQEDLIPVYKLSAAGSIIL